jgi:hypothetical protein
MKNATGISVVILLVLVGIFSLSCVSASWCYQESANVSNQTGIDGNCGLNYSGGYASVQTGDLNSFNDGNWDSFDYFYGYDAPPTDSFLQINYSLPGRALTTGNKISFKTYLGLQEYTLPESCVYENKIVLKFEEECTTYSWFMLKCYTSSGWSDLLLLDEIGYGFVCERAFEFYEEAMWWNVDEDYPQFSNNLNNPTSPANYSLSQLYQFNTTITNTNGTAFLNFNGVNYSMTNTSSNFSFSFSNLSVGNYSYYYISYGNGTNNNINQSATYFYNITKNTDECNIIFSASSPLTATASFNVWGNCSTNFILKRDGVVILNNSAQSLGAGTYNFTIERIDTQNYSNIYAERLFIVNTAPVSNPPSSSGGGGGSSYANYIINENQLEDGFYRELGLNDRFTFSFENQSHYAVLTSLNQTYVEVEVHSEVYRFSLILGQSKKVDLNNDNVYDIFFSFDSLVNNKARMGIQEIIETPNNFTQNVTSKDLSLVVNNSTSSEVVNDKSPDINWRILGLALGIFLLFMFIVGFSTFLYLRSSRSRFLRNVYTLSGKNPKLMARFVEKRTFG